MWPAAVTPRSSNALPGRGDTDVFSSRNTELKLQRQLDGAEAADLVQRVEAAALAAAGIQAAVDMLSYQ
jgi:hypothetical protein